MSADPTDLPPTTLQMRPQMAPSAYIAPGAVVIGDVSLEADASIWYNAVVRGDINRITIGARSNIQDGCILHVTNDLPCLIGPDVTVGHGAKLHACSIEPGCLIGIGAIVLSGAVIGRGSIVGAGAVVRENTRVEPFSLCVGVPAHKIRDLPASTYETHLKWAEKYRRLAALHRDYPSV